MKKNAWIKLGFLILFAGILYFCSPAKTMASPQTIRIGCVDIENFLEIDENGNAGGYGAEFLREIRKYTGWNYEYVQGSWSECMGWLKSGEIDLLLPAEYSGERARDYLFSDTPCCLDFTALVGRKSDDSYYYEDYKAFNGMTIGMIRDNYLNDAFIQYALDNHFSYRSAYFDTGTELAAALEKKEVDAIVNGNLEFTSSQKLLAKINYMPAYFITGLHNEELMSQLNNALHQIFLINPYYTASLHNKYYNSLERQSIGFTRQEAEYIQRTGNITILINQNNFPMEWYDKTADTCRGIYVDILKLIEKESDLRFTFLANDESTDIWKAVSKGKADVWGSAFRLNVDRLSEGFVYTSSYYNCSYGLVGKKVKNLDLSGPLTIALAAEEIGIRSLMEKMHPNWTILLLRKTADCLRYVEDSKADLAAVSSLGLSIHEDLQRRNLIIIDANAMSFPICLGIPAGSDPLLASVLDKSILRIDSHALESCIVNSILSIQEKLTLKTLINKHPLLSAITAFLMLALLFAGIFSVFRSKEQQRQNQLLQSKNKELEYAAALQEKLRIEAQTDSLTRLRNKSSGEYACRNYLEQYSNQSHALLVLDVDNFKAVNDNYGHLFGDTVLMQFSQTLQAIAGEKDVVARIGGDEFLLFAACIESQSQVIEQVEAFYEKIRSFVEIPLSCSIGILLSEAPHKNFNELFLAADQALYKAKSKGKNQYVIVKSPASSGLE